MKSNFIQQARARLPKVYAQDTNLGDCLTAVIKELEQLELNEQEEIPDMDVLEAWRI